jgi:hypothetical protein
MKDVAILKIETVLPSHHAPIDPVFWLLIIIVRDVGTSLQVVIQSIVPEQVEN